MAQTQTHGKPQRAGNGVSTSQEKAEERADWEGMTAMPPQESRTSSRRKLFNHMRDLAERGVEAMKRKLKSLS